LREKESINAGRSMRRRRNVRVSINTKRVEEKKKNGAQELMRKGQEGGAGEDL